MGADHNRMRVTHPDGTFFVYNFDALGRVGTIQENGSATIVSATYNTKAELQSLVRGAATTSFQYDPISRPKSIADDLAGTAGDETSGFEYNPAGQIVSQTWSNSAFAFAGRVNVTRSYSRNGLNQYTAAGPASFAYDANGNLTSDGSSTYTYDPENRLLTATGMALATLVLRSAGTALPDERGRRAPGNSVPL